MLKRTDVPKIIYIREISDVIRQLSSIGMQTFKSSHKSPFGDRMAAKTLSDHEYKQLWESLRKDNMDADSPACKGPVIFVVKAQS